MIRAKGDYDQTIDVIRHEKKKPAVALRFLRGKK